jgi:hypothetical protein
MAILLTIHGLSRTVKLHKPVATTDRGFSDFANFDDTYGAGVRVTESSAEPLDKVWVFIEGGAVNHNNGSAHLNVKQAEKLATALLSWVATQEPGYVK